MSTDPSPNQLQQIPGGAELCAWIGGTPIFADALVLDLQVRLDGVGLLTLKTWRLGPDGNYLTREPVIVTFTLTGLTSVDLIDLMQPSYIDRLVVELRQGSATVKWDAAYGVHGALTAAMIGVTFTNDCVDAG